MILIDVNLLVYAVFVDSPVHEAARDWVEVTLGGKEPVALPWPVLTGFVRVSTNPRVMTHPLTLDESIAHLDAWLVLPTVRVVEPTRAHREEFARALLGAKATGNLVSDAHLAALAVEHDCVVASTDEDFRKFPGLRWFNPLRPDLPRT